MYIYKYVYVYYIAVLLVFFWHSVKHRYQPISLQRDVVGKAEPTGSSLISVLNLRTKKLSFGLIWFLEVVEA